MYIVTALRENCPLRQDTMGATSFRAVIKVHIKPVIPDTAELLDVTGEQSGKLTVPL